MWKTVLVGTASLMLAGSSLVYAQQQSGAPAAAKPAATATATAPTTTTAEQQQLVMQEHMAAYAAAHVAALKAGLKLTPDQEKTWPALEQAMNEMTKLEMEQMNAPPPPPPAQGAAPEPDDPVADLKKRADEMMQDATALKHLSDALGPLYASLDENQKVRFHTLAPPVLSFHLRGGQNGGEQNGEPGYGGQPEEMGQNGPGGYGEPMNNGMPPQQGSYAYGGPWAPARRLWRSRWARLRNRAATVAR